MACDTRAHEPLRRMPSQSAKALGILLVCGWAVSGVAYAQPIAQLDIPYAVAPPGTDPVLLSLDVYAPLNASNLPMVVWVHGGAWAIGDKSTLFYKADWLTSNDFVLVSVNYRLSPDPPELTNTARIMHPTHAQDVAAAIAFVHQNAAAWGGSPDRIALMGHSAGAHLISLVATDARLLHAHGMTPSEVSAVVSLDSGAYDVAFRAAGSVLDTYFLNAFTDDPNVWADASPITHVTADIALPPFLLVHQTRPNRRMMPRRLQPDLALRGMPSSPILPQDCRTLISINGWAVPKILPTPVMCFPFCATLWPRPTNLCQQKPLIVEEHRQY